MKNSILFFSVVVFGTFLSCSKEVEEYEVEDLFNSNKILKNTGELLWDGAASGGTDIFQGLEFQSIIDMSYTSTSPSPAGSYIKTESDVSEGLVWHVRKAPDDRRAEARGAQGLTVKVGDTYYIGFRFKLGQIITSGAGNYHTIFQWKAYYTPMLQNIPLDLTFLNGKIYFSYRAPNSSETTDLFVSPDVSKDKWYSVVIKIVVGNLETTGNTQIWWGDDVTPETLLTGGASYTCRTFDGTLINPKWGYYNGKSNDGHIFFSQIKIGSDYQSVAPISNSEAGVYFYQNTYFGGNKSLELSNGSYTMEQLAKLGVPNDWASSAHIPSNLKVTIYQNNNFDGLSWILTEDTPSFVSLGANDEMSSCKIENKVVIFYQNTNYGGTASQALPVGNYTMSQLEAFGVPNDWASSAKIPSGLTVTLYKDNNFGGNSWILTGDTPNFISIGANDALSSCIIE